VIPQPIVIVGTGGSGRETFALLRDMERATPGTWDFRGFLGLETPQESLRGRLGMPFLGSPIELTHRIPEARSWAYVLGIGSGINRRAMEIVLSSQGLSAPTIIHPSAIIGPEVRVGRGTTVCANTVVTTNASIGEFCQFNVGCVIGHDAIIGNYVTLAQSVNLAGNVTIKEEATLFTRSVVNPGLTVGTGAVVGAGAVCIMPVEPRTTVVGVPAKPRV